MRKYVKANMCKKSHTTTKYFLKLLASIAETMIFVYLGISSVIDSHHWDWGFCILALVFSLVIRAGGMYHTINAAYCANVFT
jgi:NhaP-type Na+/H+ or K+/H+ antiporter